MPDDERIILAVPDILSESHAPPDIPTVNNVRTIIERQTEHIYIPELSPQA